MLVCYILSVIYITLFTLLYPLLTGHEFLTGRHFLALIVIIATTFIIYYAYVFGRALKLKRKITAGKKVFEIEIGRDVRNNKNA
jgi:hypothetical protein